jgi:hypothetical protein
MPKFEPFQVVATVQESFKSFSGVFICFQISVMFFLGNRLCYAIMMMDLKIFYLYDEEVVS